MKVFVWNSSLQDQCPRIQEVLFQTAISKIKDPKMVANMMVLYATDAATNGNKDLCNLYLIKAIYADPDNTNAHYMMAQIFIEDKDYKNAIETYENALEGAIKNNQSVYTDTNILIMNDILNKKESFYLSRIKSNLN